MKNILRKALITLVLAGISSAALAVPVTFDFTDDVSSWSDVIKANPLAYTEGGLTLTASTPSASVAATPVGLGVYSGGFDTMQIDHGEHLIFSFSSEVSLMSLTFGWVSYNDDASLSIDGKLVYADEIPNRPSFLSPLKKFVNVDASHHNWLPGKDFDFSTVDCNDGYYISKITVDYALPVSEPTSLGLLALGLAGLGLRRSSSKKKDTHKNIHTKEDANPPVTLPI